MLAEDAIKSAISNYYTKNPKARQTDLGGTGKLPAVKVVDHRINSPTGASVPKIEVETITETPQQATA